MDGGTLKSHYSVPSSSIDWCVGMGTHTLACVFVLAPEQGRLEGQ